MNWDNQNTDNLIKAILSLRDSNEAKNFLRDLLTEKELIEFGKRWEAAQLLEQQIPYSQIVKQTGLSSTTVARISKWLTNGSNGYKTAIDQLGTHHHAHSNDSRLREA
jgi:TrpR-related protein YerC/YecD